MKCLFVSTVVSLAALAAVASPAGAQEKWTPDSMACADSVPVASYSRCALMLDGNKVRRGVDETVVGRPGFFGPIHLERLVAGDSAKKFAMRYERRERQAGALGAIGGAAVIAGLIWIHHTTDQTCFPSFCTYKDPSAGAVATTLTGLGLGIVSIPFHIKAQRSAARAIWWNNLRFSR